MTRFKIRYIDPATGDEESVVREFEDWTGRADLNGRPVGPVMTITAREWAEDTGYTLADKGWHSVEELPDVSEAS